MPIFKKKKNKNKNKKQKQKAPEIHLTFIFNFKYKVSEHLYVACDRIRFWESHVLSWRKFNDKF